MTHGRNDEHLLVLVPIAAAGLSLAEVWVHYFALTGDIGMIEVDAYLHGLMDLPDADRWLLAYAVDELVRFPSHDNASSPFGQDT
ncbi:hypothetical protein FDK12_14370 [Arthrobacter sp. NamB2]|uniref:hypothetical protein n=1 Tax=Arthrobacter sp. NamB2 TaxID=2576035 RepID=UPI0010C9A333|nr:hypothetical protein [Arthrobacter sp. NamB2]TKV26139.1 hypothetical protein FDK12_14370 [Arthrobacter sp. NamB2]